MQLSSFRFISILIIFFQTVKNSYSLTNKRRITKIHKSTKIQIPYHTFLITYPASAPCAIKLVKNCCTPCKAQNQVASKIQAIFQATSRQVADPHQVKLRTQCGQTSRVVSRHAQRHAAECSRYEADNGSKQTSATDGEVDRQKQRRTDNGHEEPKIQDNQQT